MWFYDQESNQTLDSNREKIAMDIDLLSLANEKLSGALNDCQLDRLIASSVELRLCFITKTLPKREIWLTLSGVAFFDDDVETRSDFFEQRSRFLSQVYLSIGSRVSDVVVTQNGQLKISINGKRFAIKADSENCEEVWSVTPDSSAQYSEFDWFVAYSEDDELLVK